MPSEPLGHAVEPAGQAVALADRRSLADQEQERRLQDILGKMGIADVPTAQAEQHRPMPIDDRPKGELVAAIDEAIQQETVAKPGKRLG